MRPNEKPQHEKTAELADKLLRFTQSQMDITDEIIAPEIREKMHEKLTDAIAFLVAKAALRRACDIARQRDHEAFMQQTGRR